MKRSLFVSISILIMVGFSSIATAQTLKIVRGNGTYPPNEMIVDNQLTGLHIDLVKEVAVSLGYQVNFESVPWKRALSLIEKGTADAITYISKNP